MLIHLIVVNSLKKKMSLILKMNMN